MLVAIRKRSWEDHVTHRSGLQYSYDDLDLVCCHGVSGDGPRLASEGSKQGRRERCASMPECCHRPRPDDLNNGQGHTLEFVTSVNVHSDDLTVENRSGGLGSKDSTCSEELTSAVTAQGQHSDGGSKLDTIHEINQSEAEDDSVLLGRQGASDMGIPTSPEQERSRLDSMVLLLMKLDQLDQEIDTALSASSSSSSSSMAITPTLRRHHRRENLILTWLASGEPNTNLACFRRT
uniref:Uncharacterized protein n=1 Tax=Salmo trutta TaxID=8032 RepID=A0A673Y8J0_SALTR